MELQHRFASRSQRLFVFSKILRHDRCSLRVPLTEELDRRGGADAAALVSAFGALAAAQRWEAGELPGAMLTGARVSTGKSLATTLENTW